MPIGVQLLGLFTFPEPLDILNSFRLGRDPEELGAPQVQDRLDGIFRISRVVYVFQKSPFGAGFLVILE